MSRLFYLGPIGGMFPLPDVYSAVDVPATRIGGTHVSLTGTRTVDAFAYKRAWSWSWSNLLPWHVPYVDALQMGMVPGPLRLIDPRRINRWPEQVATGGSHLRSTRGFYLSNGSMNYRPLTQVAPDSATLPAAPVVRGCLEWNLPAVGGGSLHVVDPRRAGEDWQVPVLPDETLQLSAWVAGSSGINTRVAWHEYTKAGTATSHLGSPLALQSGTWQKVTATITPASTTVAVTGRLLADDDSTAGTVLTTAWFLGLPGVDVDLTTIPAHITMHCDTGPSDPFGGWRPGGGAPAVLVDAGNLTYHLPGLHDAGLTVIET